MPWVRAWLACLALFYPVYWVSSFLTEAAPAFLQVAFFHHQLTYFQADFRMARASSIPIETAGLHPGGRHSDPYSVWLAGLLVLLMALALSRLPRRVQALASLSTALLATLGIADCLIRLLVMRQVSAGAIVCLVVFLVVQGFGLRRLLITGGVRGYWARALDLLAIFTLPLGTLILVLFRAIPYPLLGALLTPGIVLSFVVSARPVTENEPAYPGWGQVAAGLTASLILLLTLHGHSIAAQRRQVAAKEATLTAVRRATQSMVYNRLFFQKGVNFTAEFPDMYGSSGARRMIEQLKGYGVNALAFVPYGFSPRNAPEVRFGNADERDEDIAALSAYAHQAGMKVFLKPQIWAGRGYPGDLEYRSPEDRAKWFAQYQRFVEHYAALARDIHADLFCVGVEFAKLSTYEEPWRKLIARARQIYPGPLTYAANSGPEFENLRFWDALDYIGLNAYYPLPDDLSTAEVVRKVEAVQQRFQRPVIFTEAGFCSYEKPNRQPWDESPRQLSLSDQARCYDALLRAFYKRPWFQGVYWWKVGTNGFGGPQDGTHTPWGKPAMETVARYYRDPER